MKKFAYNFINLVIPNKNTRIKLRDYLSKYLCITKPKMRLGASYSVWDGEELLRASVKSIRENVDYINVVWQKQSWYGEPCDDNLEKVLCQLKDEGLIDEIILFEPDLNKKSNINEINKRNLGLKHAKKAKCTHFLIMDTDEFYKKEEFAAAKEYILKYNITHSICGMIIYPKINFKEVQQAQWFASFIHKINRFSKLKMNACSPLPWLVDPTKQLPITLFSNICILHNISQHHFVGVRKDIIKKYKNTSANWSKEQQNSTIKYLMQSPDNMVQAGEWVHVENIFDINID